MKRTIYITTLFSLILFSCKKEHTKTTDNTLHKVTFTVSGFTKGTAPFSISGSRHPVTDALTADTLNGLNYMVYSVYDATGAYVHSILQSSDQSNFGSITDNLPAGSYTVSIAEYPGHLDDANNYSLFALAGYNTQFSSANIYYNNSTGFIDTFLKTFGITVSASSNANQAITLTRINGQLEIALTDTVPANAANINVTVSNEYLAYSISKSIPDTIDHKEALYFATPQNTPLSRTNFTLSAIVLNTVHPFNVQITCLDASKNVLASKVVNNVYCQVNKTTILSGNLFGTQTGNSTNSFTVSINPTWNPVQDTVKFSSIRRTINRVNR